jgi:hypothetical protein
MMRNECMTMMLDAEAVRRTGRVDREAATNLMVVEGVKGS